MNNRHQDYVLLQYGSCSPVVKKPDNSSANCGSTLGVNYSYLALPLSKHSRLSLCFHVNDLQATTILFFYHFKMKTIAALDCIIFSLNKSCS